MVWTDPAWPAQATLAEVTYRIKARVRWGCSPSPRSQFKSYFTVFSQFSGDVPAS
jgi:hypothetical protein